MRVWSAANALSCVGTWMQLVAQNLLVLRLTGSPAVAGVSLAVQAGPGVLLGLLGGAVVDRWPARVLATASQALLAAVAATTAVLAATGRLSVGALLALGAVTGLVGTVDSPACALVATELVPAEDLASAVAVGSVVASGGRLAGTALAGVVIGSFGVPAAYLVNAASFVVVALVIPWLRTHPVPETVAPAAPARGELVAGLRYLLRRRDLAVLLVVAALTGVLGRNYTLTLAPLVTGPLHAGATGYGAVTSVLAAGGIAGAVLAGRVRRASARLALVLAGAAMACQVVAGTAPALAVLLVVVAPMAVAESAFDTVTGAVLMATPHHLRGRVLAAWGTLSRGWGLAGPVLLGLLLQTAGVRGGLVLGGVLAAVPVWLLLAAAGPRADHRRSAVLPQPVGEAV